MDEFQGKWFENVKRKNSIICAGLDPKSTKGYVEGPELVNWGKRYLEAVIDHVSAVKPNPKFWRKHDDGQKYLREVLEYAKELDPDMLIIYDDKFPDIGSTNDAGITNANSLPIDSVTISQFPGNMTQSVGYAKENGLGVFPMCLMSNPEFERVKNGLFPIDGSDLAKFNVDHVINFGDSRFYVPNYIAWAQEAAESGATGVVIGTTGHVTQEEIMNAVFYLKENQLILAPGLGKQGGSLDTFLGAGVGLKRVAVNVGSGMMYPNGAMSTPKEQGLAAKDFNKLVREYM